MWHPKGNDFQTFTWTGLILESLWMKKSAHPRIWSWQKKCHTTPTSGLQHDTLFPRGCDGLSPRWTSCADLQTFRLAWDYCKSVRDLSTKLEIKGDSQSFSPRTMSSVSVTRNCERCDVAEPVDKIIWFSSPSKNIIVLDLFRSSLKQSKRLVKSNGKPDCSQVLIYVVKQGIILLKHIYLADVLF